MTGPGQPTIYTTALAARICSKLGSGMSLVEICSADDMPCRDTVYLWLSKHPEFSDMYVRAREEQADTLADEIIVIADTPMEGVKTKTLADGSVETTAGDMIEHRKLRVDARKWVAAKLKPRKYGDLVRNEHTGPQGGPITWVWGAPTDKA